MRKIKYIFFIIVLFLICDSVLAFDNTKKVYDYAQILTTKEEKALYNDANKFIKKYNMDMVLVTVRYHEKSTSNNYAKEFYNINKFGIGNNRSGIIVVIDMNSKTRNIGFQAFGDSKKIYSNIRIDSIIEELKNTTDDYKKFKSFIYLTREYANDGAETSIIKVKHILSNIPFIKIILLSLVMPLIIIITYIVKNKKQIEDIYIDSHIVDGSIDISIRSDRFVTTHTNSERK